MSSILPSDYKTSKRVATVTSTTGTPPLEVVEALEAGVVKVTRRVEVYEADGKTLWNPAINNDPGFSRLIDGSVSVNYTADERRTLDLTLDNRDALLRPDPVKGFWYDKIIKVFRGVQYQGSSVSPRVALIEAVTLNKANQVRRIFSSIGFTKVDYLPGVVTANELASYSFVVVVTETAATNRADLLKELWRAGKHIVSIGTGSGHTEIPLYTASGLNPGDTREWGVSPAPGDNPAQGSFTTGDATGATGTRVTATAPGVVALSVWPVAPTNTHITAAIGTAPNGAYWFDLHMPSIGTQGRLLMRSVLNFMRGYESTYVWETQLGEFVIDTLSEESFPSQMKITGRDYTKKMMLSKLENGATFASGTSLRDLLVALAANSGIDTSKIKVSTSGEKLSQDMAFERGTDRWTIAKAACEAYNYEIFFDAFGVFVVRKFIDPTTGPVSWTFKTGYEENSDGANLVKYSRSTADSNIFNHVIVYGDPIEGEERLPYYGEARNDNPNSPTRIERLGDRTLPIITNWLSSDAECVQLANDRLKIVGLESYSISFDAIYYPWLEVGEITEFLDPKRLSFEPTQFLMDTINYPLGLGVMSATAKRITFVGNPGTPGSVVLGGTG